MATTLSSAVVLPIVDSITIDKQKLLRPDDFAGHIRTLAKSDAVHDIHETTNWFNAIDKTFTQKFNASILQNIHDTNHPIEDVGFMSIMETNTGTRQEFLDTITITDSDSAAAAPFTFNVGHRNSDYTGSAFNQLHSYKGYAVSVKTTTPKNTHIPAENFAENFSQVTGLGDFALIVDFNTHDFLDSFKHGTSTVGNIYYILTPEVVNDPAPKTSMQNSMFGNTFDAAGATHGATMIPLYQVDNNSTFYSRYDNNNNAYNNNFMSAYDFKLSKLTRVITKKVESFTTDLTITTIHNSQPYTAFIVNGKHENSNKTITGLLRSLISTMSTSTSFQHEFDITTKYQQKRLGDWGQCLACLDLNNRNFMKYIEKSPSTETDQLIKDIPKLIVTHDKLCVTYALLMGANVIYLDYYGIAYIFLNTQDSTVATIPYPQLLYNTIQRLYQKSSIVNPTYPMYYILEFAKIYRIARQRALSTKYSAIREKIGEITEAYSNAVPDIINVEYIEGLILQFRELFRLCVELKYMEMYLIDVENDIPKFDSSILSEINIRPFPVTGNIDEFYANRDNSYYDNNNDATYIELYKAYNRLNGVYTQHNSTNYDPIKDTVDNIISDTWLNIVKKLDVWKSADNLFKTETTIQKTTKYDIRLLNYNNSGGEEIRINDSFMFLPYIQQINAVMRFKIMELIDFIIVPNIVIPYYSQLVIKPNTAAGFAAGAMRIFRNGAQAQDQKYFNQLVDLVYQSRVFLPPTPDEYTQDQIILSKIMAEKASTEVVSAAAAAVASGSYDTMLDADVKPHYILKFKKCIQKVIDRNKANKAATAATAATDAAAADAASYAFYEDIDYNYLELMRQEVEQEAKETREIEEFYSDLGSWALICSGINSQHIDGRTDGPETHMPAGPTITTIERPNTTITSDDAITYADFGGIMILEQRRIFSNKTKNESDIQTDYDDDETGNILPGDIETVPIQGFNPYNIQFGGHRFYNNDIVAHPRIYNTRTKMTSNTICDMSIKQTTYPLLIHYLFNKYKSPITVSVDEAMTPPDLTNKITDKIDSLRKKEQTPPTPSLEEVQARTDDVSSVQAQSDDVSSVQALSGEVPSERLDQIYNIKGGKSPINLLENRELGFHPLLPLYMVLQPFYFVISDSLVKSCFYDANLKYIKVIEKMCTELIKVINTSHQDALIIGFGLRTFIFTATRINNEEPLTLARYRKMLEIIDMTESEYRSMCNKWDIFVNTYGIIRETQEEIIEGNTYLESPIFKEFITNKVNIKQIIGTEPETYTEVELNGKVIQLLTLIVDKIWSDRNPNMLEPVQAQIDQETLVEPEKLEQVVKKIPNLIYSQPPSRFNLPVNPSRRRGQGKTRRKKNAKKTMLLNNIKKLRRLEKTIKRLKKETHKQKKRNPKKKTVKFDKESENKEFENKESENKESENKESENKEYIL